MLFAGGEHYLVAGRFSLQTRAVGRFARRALVAKLALSPSPPAIGWQDVDEQSVVVERRGWREAQACVSVGRRQGRPLEHLQMASMILHRATPDVFYSPSSVWLFASRGRRRGWTRGPSR